MSGNKEMGDVVMRGKDVQILGVMGLHDESTFEYLATLSLIDVI